jgi:hypothetical protein
MQESDKIIIRGMAENDQIAARIFVTGEVEARYIGEAASRTLININDLMCEDMKGEGREPLFIQTLNDTIRMTRFDPDFVRKCIPPEIFKNLTDAETSRIGVDMSEEKAALAELFDSAADDFGLPRLKTGKPVVPEGGGADFYEDLIQEINMSYLDAVTPVVPKGSGTDYYANAMYLSCLLLFGKPGCFGMSVAEHYALEENAEFLRTVDFRELEQYERVTHSELCQKYGDIALPTNAELNFLVELYENDARRGAY